MCSFFPIHFIKHFNLNVLQNRTQMILNFNPNIKSNKHIDIFFLDINVSWHHIHNLFDFPRFYTVPKTLINQIMTVLTYKGYREFQ